jgi:hypothetical protein
MPVYVWVNFLKFITIGLVCLRQQAWRPALHAKSFVPFVSFVDKSFVSFVDKSFVPFVDKSFVPFVPFVDKSFVSFVSFVDKSFVPFVSFVDTSLFTAPPARR